MFFARTMYTEVKMLLLWNNSSGLHLLLQFCISNLESACECHLIYIFVLTTLLPVIDTFYNDVEKYKIQKVLNHRYHLDCF